MPTNKLWIEHTEQAAWQSVDALREKLALAEQREQRLAPPIEGWRALCDALDAAKLEHALPGDSYAALIRGLLERVAAAEARAKVLERAAPPTTAVTVAIARSDERADARERLAQLDEDDDTEVDARAAGEARLFREIRARYARLVRERTRDGSGLLADIETRLGELPDLDPGELADAAADLGALALLVRRQGGIEP